MDRKVLNKKEIFEFLKKQNQQSLGKLGDDALMSFAHEIVVLKVSEQELKWAVHKHRLSPRGQYMPNFSELRDHLGVVQKPKGKEAGCENCHQGWIEGRLVQQRENRLNDYIGDVWAFRCPECESGKAKPGDINFWNDDSKYFEKIKI